MVAETEIEQPAWIVQQCRAAGAKVGVLEGRIRVEGALPAELSAQLRERRKEVGAYLQAEADAYRLAAEVWRLKDAGQHAAASALFDSPAYLAAFDRVMEATG